MPGDAANVEAPAAVAHISLIWEHLIHLQLFFSVSVILSLPHYVYPHLRMNATVFTRPALKLSWSANNPGVINSERRTHTHGPSLVIQIQSQVNLSHRGLFLYRECSSRKQRNKKGMQLGSPENQETGTQANREYMEHRKAQGKHSC